MAVTWAALPERGHPACLCGQDGRAPTGEAIYAEAFADVISRAFV